MAKGYLKLLPRTVCLAFGLVVWGGSAHATIYRGGLDPQYTNGFADIDVPASCVMVGSGFETNACGVIDLVGATITVTDSPLASFTVTWGFASNGITGLRWSEGELLGIDGGPFHSLSPHSQYDLAFDSSTLTAAITCHQTPRIVNIQSDDDGPNLCADLAGDPAKQEGFQPVGAAVPEPGVLVLLLGAFAAAWLSRRKFHIV